MRARMTLTIAAMLLFLPVATAAAGDCRVMVLRESGEGIALERVPLVEGEERVFGSGEIITVVLPFGAGMSGDVVQAADRTGSIGVVCEGGYVRTTVHRAGREPRSLPDVLLSDAESFDLRVNVTPGEGAKRAFLVRGYETVEVAEGPVIDMFGGAVPILAGDYAVTTEVSPAEERPVLSGSVPLRVVDGFLLVDGSVAGGGDGAFVVDFGAGGTVITRELLPAGVEIAPLLAYEHSPEGTQVLPGVMTGAGGEVEGFLGAALLHEFTLGEMVMSHMSVGVIEEMPVWGEEPVVGILGVDVLERAGVASMTIDENGVGRLELTGSGASAAPEGAIELPFTTAADHMFIEGAVGEVPVTFLFDTGARSTVLPLGIAEAAGLEAGSLPDRDLRGLDGGLLPARSVRAEGLELCGAPFGPFDVYTAELPVLEGLGLDEESGLLGIDFLLGFGRVDVDFDAGVIRLWQRAP